MAVMAQQENKLTPIGSNNLPIIGADYFNVNTGKPFRVIEYHNKVLHIGDKWVPAVCYACVDNAGKLKPKVFVRTLSDFQQNFAESVDRFGDYYKL